jgi:hypothetical protein
MDWLGYSPADLVPFSLDTWLRLVAAYNAAHLSAVLGGLAAGMAVLWLAAGAAAWRSRPALALLGGCWLWVAWAFLHRALGPLLWAADWLALGFAVQGALLLLSALLPLRGSAQPPRWARLAGWCLLACGVVLLPLAQGLLGRELAAVGWFGTSPTPTALATLGLVALLPGGRAWPLLPLPVLWCLLASAMLGVFAEPLWPLPGAAAAAAVLLRLAPRGKGPIRQLSQ